MDGQDDRPSLNDTARNPSNLKRKRPYADENVNTSSSAKRQDSRPALDQRTHIRHSIDDREPSSPGHRRGRSRSAESRTSSQRKSRYSPEWTQSRDYRSPISRDSPFFVRKNSLDEDYGRRNSDRGRINRSPEQYQERSPPRGQDRRGSDRGPRPRSRDRYEDSERSAGPRLGDSIPPHTTRVDRSSQDIPVSSSSRRTSKNDIDYTEAQHLRPNGRSTGINSDRPISMYTPDPLAISDLMAVLGQFGKDVMEQSSLELQRVSLKNHVDQKRAEYEKGSRHHKSFPALAETQKAALEKAQKNLDTIEQELKQKQDSAKLTIGKIAERILPPKQEVDSKSVEDLQGRFEDMATKQRSLGEKLDREQKTWLERTELNTRHEFIAVRADISKLSTGMEEVVLKKDLTVVNTKLDALTLQMGSLRGSPTRVTNVQDEMKSVGSDGNSNTLKSDIERLKNDIEKLNKNVFGEEDDVSLRIIVEELQHSQEKFRTALKQLEAWVNDDVGTRMQGELVVCEENIQKIASRVEALEARPITAASSEIAISSATISNLQDELKILSAGQDAVGGTLDEFRQELKGAEITQSQVKMDVEHMKTSITSYTASSNQLQEQSGKDILNLQKDIRSLHQSVLDGVANGSSEQQSQSTLQLSQRIGTLDNRLASFDARLSGIQQNWSTAFSPLPGQPVSAIPNIHHLYNSIEGLKLGYNNLDSRMNNLSTETLAKQMLGQLDNVYPSLRTVDKFISEQTTHNEGMDHRLLAIEGRPATNVAAGGAPSPKELEDLSVTMATIKGDLEDTKKHFKKTYDRLLQDVGTLEADSEQHRDDMEKLKESIDSHEALIDGISEEIQQLKYESSERGKIFEEVKNKNGNLQERASKQKPDMPKKPNGQKRRKQIQTGFVESEED